MNCYLVTSAINTRFGVFDSWSRLTQTLHTIRSIRDRDPTGIIVLAEMAAIPLHRLQADVIKKSVDYLVDFTNEQTVKDLYNATDNWDIVKNVNEVTCFKHVLEMILKQQLPLANVQRFFKVSGRYVLTDTFNPLLHTGEQYVFSRRRVSQFPPELTGGCTHQFMSRCWSFPASKVADVIEAYSKFQQSMSQHLQQGNYIDIEHCLFLHFSNASNTVEVDRIGVAGHIGPNGVTVED